MKTYHDSTGTTVTIGHEIGHGGEGSVHEVHARSDWVAKVYHKPADTMRAAKLRAMVAVADAAIVQIAAWPVQTLHAQVNGPVVGLLMPKVTAHTEIHHLYSPTQQSVRFPGCTWRFLVHVSMNCAAAVDTVHQRGHVIGDVNQSGFMVSQQGTVTLIDCDSFQIRRNGTIYRCDVGVPDYTAPELTGKNFSTIDRTCQHDNFALAVLIFHILFMGRHPFAGRYQGRGDMPIERAIHEGRFAFSSHAASLQMQPPPFSLSLSSLPHDIAQMFERALRGQPADRPSASDWFQALGRLRSNIATCPTDAAHQFPSGQRACPWCTIESAGGPVFFTAVTAYDQFDHGFDLAVEWAKIAAIHPPCAVKDFVWPRVSKPTPTPIPTEAAYASKGLPQTYPPTPTLEIIALPPLPEYRAEATVQKPPPEFAPDPLPPLPELDDFPPPVLEKVPALPRLEDFPDDAPPEPHFEPLPDELGPFVPETVPDDPPLHLLPDPSPAIPDITDALLTLEAQRRQLLQDPNYQQARMITYAAGAVAIIGVFVHWIMVVAALALALPTACVWLAMAWPIRAAYRRPHRKLIRDRRLAEERYRLQKDSTDKTNHAVRDQWNKTVAELRSRRTGLEARNEAAYAAWLAAKKRNDEERRDIAHRNESVRAAWRSACEAADAARMHRWKRRTSHIEELRNEIEARNTLTLEEWREVAEIALQSSLAQAEEERSKVIARNDEKRRRWKQIVEHREADRIAEWEQRRKKVQREREEANRLNIERRARWEIERAAHEKSVAGVKAHNRNLQQSQEAFRSLLQKREANVTGITRAIDTVMARLRSELDHLQRGWTQAQNDARLARDEYQQLKQRFEKEKAQSIGDPRQNQLDDHLRAALLYKARIPQIGRARKATLRSYGIETAYDITMPQIGNVPGIGPAYVRNLIAWRQDIISQFVYTPGKHTNQTVLRQIHAKYRTQKEQAKRLLLSARERLAEASRKSQALVADTAREAHAREVELAQAVVDLESAREYERTNQIRE